jgi:hypothetical protein
MQYRDQANDAEEKASNASDDDLKRSYLLLSKAWLELANQVEQESGLT